MSVLIAMFLALSAVSAVSGDGSDPLDPSDGGCLLYTSPSPRD